PLDGSVKAELRLLDPVLTAVGQATATAAGQAVLLPATGPLPEGTYRLDVTSLAGAGDYRLHLVVHAALGQEDYNRPPNAAFARPPDPGRRRPAARGAARPPRGLGTGRPGRGRPLRVPAGGGPVRQPPGHAPGRQRARRGALRPRRLPRAGDAGPARRRRP